MTRLRALFLDAIPVVAILPLALAFSLAAAGLYDEAARFAVLALVAVAVLAPVLAVAVAVAAQDDTPD